MSRPVLLTAEEAAEMLRSRLSTLRDYSRRGTVPCVHIGRHIGFVEADLPRWLDGLKGGVEAS